MSQLHEVDVSLTMHSGSPPRGDSSWISWLAAFDPDTVVRLLPTNCPLSGWLICGAGAGPVVALGFGSSVAVGVDAAGVDSVAVSSAVVCGAEVAGVSSACAVDNAGAASAMAQPSNRAAIAATLRECRGRADVLKTAVRAGADTIHPLPQFEG